MIFSINQLFSDDQAITASAASTNYIDLGAVGTPARAAAPLPRDQGKGNKVPFLAQVTADFATLTSLAISLEMDDNTGFSSATVLSTQSIAVADLLAGKQIALDVLPRDLTERYIRLNYVVTGSAATAGTITAGITMGNQSNDV